MNQVRIDVAAAAAVLALVLLGIGRQWREGNCTSGQDGPPLVFLPFSSLCVSCRSSCCNVLSSPRLIGSLQEKQKGRLNHSSFSYKEYFISAQCAVIFLKICRGEKRARNFNLSGGKCGGRMELLNFAAPEFKAIRISSRFLIPSSLQQSQLFLRFSPGLRSFVHCCLPTSSLSFGGSHHSSQRQFPSDIIAERKKEKKKTSTSLPSPHGMLQRKRRRGLPRSSKKGFCSKLKRKVKIKLPGGMRRKGTKSQRPCAALK